MRLLGLTLLCLALACSESFAPASFVSNLRVVGARVEADGQAERARPEPGDEVEVSLLVIDQGAQPKMPTLTPALLQWTLDACIPQPTSIGVPICGPGIEPCDGCEGTPPQDPLDFPVVRFQVPSATKLEDAQADSVLLQGIVCIHGVPSGEAIKRLLLGETNELEPCEAEPPPPDQEGPLPPPPPDPEGRVVNVQIPIESTPEDPNLNPEISDVRLNGMSWPPPYDKSVPRSALREGCLESLTPEQLPLHPIAGSPSSEIKLTVPLESLQSYMVGDRSLREELQVSWLADGGSLERTFSFITASEDSSESPDPALTNWRPFADVPAGGGGVLVRFNFVIRDGRGGTDWVERGLCVRPAPPMESPP